MTYNVKDHLDRIEAKIEKAEIDSLKKPWPGDVRRAMANIGVKQGVNGLPEINIDRNGKTVFQIHKESYELRFEDLSRRHKALKADYASLQNELATLKQQLAEARFGDTANSETLEGEVMKDLEPLSIEVIPNG